MSKLIQNVAFNEQNVAVFPPMRLEHRHKGTSLTALGACLVTFDEDGETATVTMEVDEVIYVIEGDLTLTVDGDGKSHVVAGVAGDVLTIKNGANVRYAGTTQTRLFLSFSPC
ncbi:hypothetical protein FZI85_29775 [Mycobacterium sp. CBMA293]|uniref:cupin domain-containing protein n=1 Tax=unclassified Mycolicibacterium TaxID=2636767 RepID=UPI0012DE3B6F|nr:MULTISPECIES: cupin domain-containing protein [unclassified Mycolicibacterium]MUL49883.1 hypothetical protein [Mycolicibacterium sp. CBMA 360]MUL62702.1 hypothetical protein [Mycolicibacterium sp. CBMA 335]MUL70750.1 hypothetical protein [Mycolicibacterium sp. CBMA 311]MUL97226.1 hypothetical protein [Mycolicibacterium sp. CBMA 230]MUM07975.1 hypothetical protein [Mycolicibacterium sp. CBMA 213]